MSTHTQGACSQKPSCQDTIKLYMACNVLECFDKLCCAFNCHVLDALQNSVYIVVNTAATSSSKMELFHANLQLSVDVSLTLFATVTHTLILLTHAAGRCRFTPGAYTRSR